MPAEKPLLRVLSGERVNPPPIWIMRQAGRYLPEYRSVRRQAGDFLSLCFSPELAAEVTIQPVRRFGFDAAILFADILLLPYALGSSLSFEEGSGPRLSRISNRRDVDALRGAEAVHQTLAPVSATLRLVKPRLPGGTALIGFAGSPWTVATYMIAGRGIPGQAPALRFMREQRVAFDQLITLLTRATIEYLSDQINAGAEVVKLFDSWAGSLGGADFEDYVCKPNARIVSELNHRHPGTPIIAFPRQAGAQLGTFEAVAGADCIALDPSVRPAEANAGLGARVCVQGNLDPELLIGDGAGLAEAATSILDGFAGRPHIFNLGHGITPEAQIENVERLVRIVRDWTPRTS
ncbi:MAG: uroporphyrinogen decarboxylase [Rhodobacteraceae bacterium]|nr:uroporphyrinogen decarboxylase [Paracoccaceae bacterium]